jgi:DNA processing protein
LSAAAKELAQAAGVRLLTWDEPEYPERLREIYDPPPLLYVLGNIDLLKRHILAIVGARRPTPYGNQMAERLAKDLAERGLVIASGLARGIDSSAHQGALRATGERRLESWDRGLTSYIPRKTRRYTSRWWSAA